MTKIFYLTLLIILVVIVNCIQLKAQTRLVFLRGQEKRVKIIDTNGRSVRVYDSSAFFLKHRSYRKHQLFSLADYQGKEFIYYREDSLFGNFLTISQMRSYIKGEQDAQAFYHAPVAFGIGAAFGVGAALIVNMASTLTPIVACLPSGFVEFDIPKIDPTKIRIHSESYRKDNAYLAGYIDKMHRKRVKNAFWGGISGLAVALPILLIVIHNNR